MNTLVQAKHSISLLSNDSNVDCIEITYKKYIHGVGYRTKTDYVYTKPAGNWVELKFYNEDNVEYSNFLNTMVTKNLDVHRKLAKIELDRILDSPGMYRINLLNAICILDPTFIPPIINKRCRWQCDLLEDIVSKTSLYVISTSRNERRLERYFNALCSLKV